MYLFLTILKIHFSKRLCNNINLQCLHLASSENNPSRERRFLTKKKKIATFIHSFILTFYSRKSLCIQHSIECSQTFAIRWQVRARVFVDRAIEKEYRVLDARAQTIRHVCSISSFAVSYAMIMHHHHRTPSPPSRAVIHKSSEIRPRFLLQSIPDGVTSSDYAVCNTSAVRESIRFYL